MFASQDPLSQSIIMTDEQTSPVPEYPWITLFDWCVDNRRPFGVFPTSLFRSNEIKETWLISTLDQESRVKLLPKLESFPGKFYSLFGKIQKGNLRK